MDAINYIVTGGGAFVLFLLGVVWRISENKLANLTVKVDNAVADIAAFKLDVSKEYASISALEKMEKRIMDELAKIESTQREIVAELKLKADKP